MTLVMLDTITLNALEGFGVVPDALAGYVNGNWPTYSELHKYAPPGCYLLSITVNAVGEAECLDVEPGDAPINAAAAWVKAAINRGVVRPVVYSSVSAIDSVVASLKAGGVDRNQVRLWAAHYEAGTHICGPTTCHQTSWPCDGTQWTEHAGGRNLDQSILLANFFSGAPVGRGLHLDEASSMFFLEQGPNVATPISIPNGANHVRFASNDKAEVHVDMMTHGTDVDVALSYASGPHAIPLPAGCHMVIAHRVDGGANLVSASFYA
jgi:hypothetical protein